MPICYLLVEALQQYDAFFGDAMQVPLPATTATATATTVSGSHSSGAGEKGRGPAARKQGSLWTAASEISQRLIGMFRTAAPGSPAARGSVLGAGHRPVYGGLRVHGDDPVLRRLVLFYEYFHGDLGAGLGASHQTGWTGLVAKLIQQQSATPTLPVGH